MPKSLTISDDVTKKILELEKAVPGTINKIAAAMAVKFKEHARDRYMSGQVLGERTGKAKDNLIDRYKRLGTFELLTPRLANIFEGGATINPVKGAAIRFTNASGQNVFVRGSIQLEPHPFWSMSWSDFIASSYADRVAEEIINREWTKRFN